ncbi:MAG TPA: efflux RND transporter periplasmic adaptor subunit [Gemmata sp.]|nr:efflux RND transporter periplasmic adaptor subunit [Gemmata sp.]
MNARMVLVAGLGLAALFLGSGCRGSDPSSGQGSSGEGKPVYVTAVHPEVGGVERTVTRPGSVHAFHFADLYAKVSGYLQHQSIDIGYEARANELLADIYAPELEKDVARETAALSKAHAQVTAAESHQAAADADLKEARQKVDQQKAQLASSSAMVSLRDAQYVRIKALAQGMAIAQELADEQLQAKLSAEADERAARVAVTTAEAAVTASEAKLAAAKADVVDAQASVRVAEAALARTKVLEEYTHLRAPFAGVITHRTYHNGDFIEDAASTRKKPVYRIARTDLMRVIVDVPDPDVPYTRKGRRAEVRIDSLRGKVFPGVVARTAGAEDYTNRAMRTEVDLPNPDGILSDGMFGEVTLFLGKSADGLSIPSECFAGPEKKGKRPVFVVRDGIARRIDVQVGLDDGIRAEVLSGLTA